MFFDQKKFVEAIRSLTETDVSQVRYSYYYAEKEMREKFFPIFNDSVSWESEEEKSKVFDYMRKFGVQDQVERDFSARRQEVEGRLVFVPPYETWSAADALLMLMTYRNSPKLVQATVQEHRNFIQEVAGNLLPDDSINWIYKTPDECDRALDRGYSYMTFPVVAQGAAYYEYFYKLTRQKKVQDEKQEELNKTLAEVEKLTSLVTSVLSQLQTV